MGASSSSWVLGAYACRELGGGVTCENILGLLHGSLKSMVFLFSNGIRITPFGVGTWNKTQGSRPDTFRTKSSWV